MDPINIITPYIIHFLNPVQSLVYYRLCSNTITSYIIFESCSKFTTRSLHSSMSSYMRSLQERKLAYYISATGFEAMVYKQD